MTNANTYNVDFARLSEWLIPAYMRKTKLAAWLLALLTPVIFLYIDFKRYKKAKEYQLMITPQVCYLERMLNDAFDNTQRRIVIVDAVWHQPLFIYQTAENKPVDLFTEAENNPVTIWTDGEAGMFNDDFIIQVPLGLVFDNEQMKGMVNGYKLVGTKYTIQIV